MSAVPLIDVCANADALLIVLCGLDAHALAAALAVAGARAVDRATDAALQKRYVA